MLDYSYKACELGMTEKIVEMAINASGIRDTARVLKIKKNTVINRLKKKESSLVQVNPIFQIPTVDAKIEFVCEEAEIDEQWSFVEKNLINAEFGMLLNIQQIQFLLMFLESVKMLFSKS